MDGLFTENEDAQKSLRQKSQVKFNQKEFIRKKINIMKVLFEMLNLVD